MKFKNKFKLLSTSTLTLLVCTFPLTTVVSCGKSSVIKNDDNSDNNKPNDTKNSQSITFENDTWLQTINNATFDSKFGFIESDLATDTTASSENSLRASYGNAYSFRGYSDHIKNWSKNSYKDAPFLSSWRKIANKKDAEFYKDTQAKNGAEFHMLDGISNSTANTPITALKTTDNQGFAFEFWQYTDTFNAWGGAGGEGVFLTPPAEWINAAHRNGVPVLGTFFGPPATYGGSLQETLNLIKKEGNTYPLADKMIEIAKEYGFDGWVLNFETETGDNNTNWKDNIVQFMQYLHSKAKTAGQIIQSYGSFSDSKAPQYLAINDQSKSVILDSQNQPIVNQYLVDYRHTNTQSGKQTFKSDINYLKNLGIEESEAVKLASYGVNFEFSGLSGAGKEFKHIYDNVKDYNSSHNGENQASIWSYTFKKAANQNEDTRMQYFSTVADTKDVRFNSLTNYTEGIFTSISNLYAESTVLMNRSPFSSSFNIGNGNKFYWNGNAVSFALHPEATGITSMGSQDILPTYRWWTDTYNGSSLVSDPLVKSDETIIPKFVSDRSWKGTNAIKYDGNLKAGYHFENKLFATDINMLENDTFEIIYQGSEEPQAIIWTDKDTTHKVSKDGEIESLANNWKRAKFKLSENKTVKSIGVGFKNNTSNDVSLDLHLGSLSYIPSSSQSIEDTKIGEIWNQGVFKVRKSGSFSKDILTYRLAFDSISNADDVKYIKYSLVGKDGTIVPQSISGSKGILLRDINVKNNHVVHDGKKYIKIKLEFITDTNEIKNSQNILVKVDHWDQEELSTWS